MAIDAVHHPVDEATYMHFSARQWNGGGRQRSETSDFG